MLMIFRLRRARVVSYFVPICHPSAYRSTNGFEANASYALEIYVNLTLEHKVLDLVLASTTWCVSSAKTGFLQRRTYPAWQIQMYERI